MCYAPCSRTFMLPVHPSGILQICALAYISLNILHIMSAILFMWHRKHERIRNGLLIRVQLKKFRYVISLQQIIVVPINTCSSWWPLSSDNTSKKSATKVGSCRNNRLRNNSEWHTKWFSILGDSCQSIEQISTKDTYEDPGYILESLVNSNRSSRSNIN